MARILIVECLSVLMLGCSTGVDNSPSADTAHSLRELGPIWIAPERLATLPMTGRPWEKLKRVADRDLGQPNLAGFTANGDVKTLAVGLVYARTGDEQYRRKAAVAIMSAVGSEHTGLLKGPGSQQGALAVSLARNLVSYVIAADLIRLSDYDPEMDRRFRTWIESLRHEEWPDRSLVLNDEKHANNHGRMAGAARAAIAVYLGDLEDLGRTAQVFKGLLGDAESYAGFRYRRDPSWHADPQRPLGVNPAGTMIDEFAVGGMLPEEMRRGCPFQVPPCPTHYPWEALQGIVVEAVILSNQGYDVWNWSDQAIFRAMKLLERLHTSYPDDLWWATGDDTWVPWVVNFFYGTSFPTLPPKMGKNMGWTDWTHGSPPTP